MIDPKVKAQRNQANSGGRFVMGAQASSVPIILVDGSADNLVMMANPSFLRMSGKSDLQLIGGPLATALSGMMNAKNIAYVAERLALDQPATWEVETRNLDGSIKVICVFDCPLAVVGPKDHQHLLTFFVRNETVQPDQRTVSEMRASYMHAPGFIATTEGPEHRLTFANDSFKQYVGKRQLEGLTVVEAMPETVGQGFVDLLDNVFATGIPYHGKAVPYEFPDAETGEMTRRYGDFVYAAVRDADAKIIGIFCEGYDITKQKEAEAAFAMLTTKVAHTSRVNAMGTMATTMAHELNQPLTAILNFATGGLRLLDRPDTDIEVVKQALTSIKESGERAASVIRTLRDLTDRRTRAHAEFKLKPVVAEVLNLVRNSCSVDTELRADVDAELILNADRVQIQQVIINLVRNACDAVHGLKEQKVQLTAETNTSEVVISVRDTGQGVAAESAQDIFTWVDSAKESGMGLGLSICRTIIESHGGRIWLEDSSEQGSDFRFSLPRRQEDLP